MKISTSKTDRAISHVFIIGLILLGCFLTFLSLPLISTSVFGTNVTNASILTKVYVWNTEPNITSVEVEPSSIDLVAGNFTIVNCTAYVFDYNGWEDIANVSGSFYDQSEGDGDTTDQNFRYVNDTCAACTDAGGSGTNASCQCQFTVGYYANAGEWVCNMTITDGGGNATERLHYFNDSQNSSSVTINSVLGINAPSEIDYGNLSVTETSNIVAANVTNWGNVPINVTLRAFGGLNESVTNAGNYSMMCQFGNISIDLERWSMNATAEFDNMTNITNSSVLIPSLTIPVRSNETIDGNATNTTYWKLSVPLGVGGYCNGTIVFGAVQAQ